jgi:PAS domain S-box-containing protein
VSEEKYRQLFERSPMPMWVYEIDGFQILDVNDAAIMHYGYSKEEFTSMKVYSLRPDEEVGKFLAIDRAAKHGLRNFGVWRHQKKDGTLIDVEINSHGLDFANKPSRLVVANDVTEKLKMGQALAESENRLRSIYDTEPECINLLGPKGELIEMNPQDWP